MSGLDAPFTRYLPLNYTVTLKLRFGVTQGHRSGLFDRAHTTLYSSSVVNIFFCLLPFLRYSRIFVENHYPLVFGALLGVKPSDLRNDP